MRKVRWVLIAGLLVFALAQLLQPERTNPRSDPAATFEAVGIAPVSWLIGRDVREGRAHLNFSEWSLYGPEMSRLRLKAICAEAAQGNMPAKLLHAFAPECAAHGG